MPSVFHRELETNYGVVPLFPTDSPTESSNHRRNYRRKRAVGISQIVWKKLRLCHYFRRTHRPTQAITGRNTDGTIPSVFHREFEKNYGLSTISDGITDGHHWRKLHIPKRTLSEKPLLPTEYPSVIAIGNYWRQLPTDKNKRRYFRKFWCAFQFISRWNYRWK